MKQIAENPIVRNNIRIVLIIFCFVILNSCGQKTINKDIIGDWISVKHKITVRTRDERNKFEFISDSIYTSLSINDDKSVNGYIGSAEIEHGKLTSNWLLPSKMTGVAYTIKCKVKGKIFENDPYETKDVQFWIGPQFKDGVWELRYTGKGAKFPMAFIYLNKKDDS